MGDTSDAAFTVEVLRVMSPNGKEHFLPGDKVPIVWKTYGTSKPVATAFVQYSVDGGSTWRTAAKLTGNPGTCGWIVPAAVVSTGKCRVRVVLRAASGAIVGKDISDANFRVGIADVLTGVNGSGSWSKAVLP